ncbi:MAG: GTPase Era [Clostridiales bacterium]|nr:GTPase Era [Clostridiales bacterium]
MYVPTKRRGGNKLKSGFIALIGRPNVGKSTLMNLFIGEKISIVSAKPQTTRNQIRSILTRENEFQMVFLDTPGIHQPRTKLGDYMVKSAETALNESDAVLFMVEPLRKIPEGDAAILERLRRVSSPVFLVINKVDTVDKPAILKVIDGYRHLYAFRDVVPISALKADNAEVLLDAVKAVLPEGPMYFPDDMVTDQPERTIVAEMIREKALNYLQEEIPHGLAVEIMFMRAREGQDMVDIEANIYCEKDSHKAIVIGKNGEMLKKIGGAARRDAEALLGSRIYLQLWVKVKKNWRDNDFLLKNFGYNPKDIG